MKRTLVALLPPCLALLAPVVRADDTVHACIASSTDGQTMRKQGRLLEARGSMLACARDACPPVVRSHCARWLAEIEAEIPSIVVRVQDPSGNDVIDAHLTIDGRASPLDGHPVQLDPGTHGVRVDAVNGARVEERVLVAEGEASRLVTLHLTGGTSSERPHEVVDRDVPGSRSVPTGAWVLGGAGLVSLAAGSYFVLKAKSDLDGLESTCSPYCTQAQTQPGRTSSLVGDVLLATGGVALGGALVWALAFPTRAPLRVAGLSPRVTILPGRSGVAAGLALAY